MKKKSKPEGNRGNDQCEPSAAVKKLPPDVLRETGVTGKGLQGKENVVPSDNSIRGGAPDQ